ncbi:MAG: ABC transporter ATP-binding protein [Candidatus Kuenenia sp.]|nr:ABC transporter ATP-binding protein [Candidatus Kuenenia hertensis]
MVLKWLVGDSIWRFRKESFLILFTNFLGVSFQVWTIGLAIYYAKAMQSGKTIKLLHYEFNARTSNLLLILCGLSILFSLLIAAWSIYFSKSKGLKLRRKYEEFCAKRIFLIFGSGFKIGTPVEQDFSNDKTIARLARRDSRFCSRALWMILDTIIPLVTFFVAIATLLYINALLTLLNFTLMGISAFFLYKVSVYAARNSASLEKFAKRTSKEYLRIIQRQKALVVSTPENEQWLEKNFFSSGPIKKFHDAYEARLKSLEYSHLISNVVLALAIFLILLIMGKSIISEGKGWGELIVYLIALRFMLTNMRQVNRKATGINRLYPQIRRYFQFLSTAVITPVAGTVPPVNYTITKTTTPAIEGSLENWEIKKGCRIGLLSPSALNRYTLGFLTDCILGHSSEKTKSALESMWFVTANYEFLPKRSLRESLGFSKEYTTDNLQRDLEKIGLWKKYIELLPGNLDTSLSPDIWRRIDPDIKFSLTLFNALQSNCHWIMLEEKGLRTLSDSARNYILEQCSDKITTIVFYKDHTTVGNYCEDIIAAIAHGEIIGLGSINWFKTNHDAIKDIQMQEYHKNKEKDTDDFDLDEDLDDDEI